MLLMIDRLTAPPRETGPVRFKLNVWAPELATAMLPFMLMVLDSVRSAFNGTRGAGVVEVLTMVTVPRPSGPDVIDPDSPTVLTPSCAAPGELAPLPLRPMFEPPVKVFCALKVTGFTLFAL